jgi:hypothetical protein
MTSEARSPNGSAHDDNVEIGLAADDSLGHSKGYVSRILPTHSKGWKSQLFCNLSFRTVWLLVLGFAALLIVGIVLQVTLDTPEDPEPSGENNIFRPRDTTDPTLLGGESSRLRILREMLVPVSGIQSLIDPRTPQYSALLWLADDDPAFLDLVKTPFESISDRYKLALLYFATSGSTWRMQHDFLTETSICDWNDGLAGGVFEGIKCEENQVVEIMLGKLCSKL